MKISTTFHQKIPVPGVEYGSQGYHCTIEAEPPPEIQQDRDKLRAYVTKLFAECRARVEDELAQNQDHDRTNGRSNRRRQFVPPRRPATAHSGNGRNSNGRASPRQVNYLKSLANEAGLGYGGLRDLAQEEFDKDVRDLSKREASRLIDELRPHESA